MHPFLHKILADPVDPGVLVVLSLLGCRRERLLLVGKSDCIVVVLNNISNLNKTFYYF
jgi:hypothetical protein